MVEKLISNRGESVASSRAGGERRRCPRCGKAFTCQANTTNHCQCQAVPLGPEQLAYIAQRYSGCLCAGCLGELGREYDAATQGAAER